MGSSSPNKRLELTSATLGYRINCADGLVDGHLRHAGEIDGGELAVDAFLTSAHGVKAGGWDTPKVRSTSPWGLGAMDRSQPRALSNSLGRSVAALLTISTTVSGFQGIVATAYSMKVPPPLPCRPLLFILDPETNSFGRQPNHFPQPLFVGSELRMTKKAPDVSGNFERADIQPNQTIPAMNQA